MSKVSFLGAGSWGTALAIMLAQNGHDVTLWSKVQAEVDMLQQHREHIHRLPGVKLPDSIVVTSDLKQACEGNDLIVFSVASPFVRATAKEAAVYIPEGQRVVNVAKGIEEDTLMTLCDIIKQEIPWQKLPQCLGSPVPVPMSWCMATNSPRSKSAAGSLFQRISFSHGSTRTAVQKTHRCKPAKKSSPN